VGGVFIGQVRLGQVHSANLLCFSLYYYGITLS
jgi:hypothetical protein